MLLSLMDSIVDFPEKQKEVFFSGGACLTAPFPHPEQRRGSTPAVMVGAGGHRKLCRVAHGQRVVLGTQPPVFVAELRPSASSEILSFAQTSPKARSPLNVEIDEMPTAVMTMKLLEVQDSDPSYTSGSEHSALSRNTSEASDTLSVECAYSPTLSSTSVASHITDPYSNSRSPVTAVSSTSSHELASDFSKLSLDSGYGGSFPLCATKSDVSAVISCPIDGGDFCQPVQSTGYDGISSDYYASLLDFSLKLGYSENQLKSVLVKLGTKNPAQDKVLSELIKLGQDVQETATSTENAPAVIDPHCNAALGNGLQQRNNQGNLRAIVIDGSNVAMAHGSKVVFSCLGIRHCVDWFRHRGHTDIKVFVPQFRKEQSRSDNPITDQHILFDLEKENMLVWTPSRRLGGRRIICHDDRYILKAAAEKDAIIVSNDAYRDMVNENPDFRKAVEERLLMYNFIDGKFVVPDDPLGRYGPRLDLFLSKSTPNSTAPACPYGRKCTYGNKCKFYHPERPGGLHRSVTERLRDHAEMHRRISPTNSLQYPPSTDNFRNLSPFPGMTENVGQKQAAFRTRSLNPAALLRQTNNSNCNTTSRGRYSPPSLVPSYHGYPYPQSTDNHLIQEQRNNQMCYNALVQGLQAEYGHTSLSKQLSNPEAAGSNYFRPQRGMSTSPGFPSDGTTYLQPPPPHHQSFLRQIWQNEQNQPQQHPPVTRNISMPGTNVLRRAPLSFIPPTNNSIFISNSVSDQQRKNSVSDSQLNLLGSVMSVNVTTPVDVDDAFGPSTGGSNYYIPSTTVWGPVEHSSSPVFTSPTTVGWTSSSGQSLGAQVSVSGNTSSSPVHTLEVARSKVYYHLSQLFSEHLVGAVMRANPDETDPQKLCSLIIAKREQMLENENKEDSVKQS